MYEDEEDEDIPNLERDLELAEIRTERKRKKVGNLRWIIRIWKELTMK